MNVKGCGNQKEGKKTNKTVDLLGVVVGKVVSEKPRGRRGGGRFQLFRYSRKNSKEGWERRGGRSQSSAVCRGYL